MDVHTYMYRHLHVHAHTCTVTAPERGREGGRKEYLLKGVVAEVKSLGSLAIFLPQAAGNALHIFTSKSHLDNEP